MRFGIYSRDGFPVASSFARGCRGAGITPALRSLSDWRSDCWEPFDAVFIFGLRGKGRDILAAYPDAYVIDYGYLRRVMGVDTFETGHWQISRGGLNRPPLDDSPQRFRALGLTIKPWTAHIRPRILCSQSVGDASHPFDTAEKLAAWVAGVPHDEHRPHPLEQAPTETLDDMLKRAGKVITWNSTVGIDALLAGVPVEAHGPACYAGVTARRPFFNRLANGQWTSQEMADGLPQKRILDEQTRLV